MCVVFEKCSDVDWVYLFLWHRVCLEDFQKSTWAEAEEGLMLQMDPQGQSLLLTTTALLLSPNSLQAMPRPHPSTPRSTETSSSPPPCRRQSCSATPPATRCPRRTAKLRWCTSPWASCPDLRPPASTTRRSTGERAPTLQQPWPSYHTQVRRAALQHIPPV